LESVGSQKQRKTEANLKKDSFGGRRKCGKTWSVFKSLEGSRVRWRCSQLLYSSNGTEVYTTTNITAAAETAATTTTTTTTIT